MADLNHNGIDDALEAQVYKSRAVSAKFKQQVAYGLGAATVFGLVGAIAKAMIEPLLAGGITMASVVSLPALGLVALATVGIGLLYLSAKFLSENTVLDQQLQANQISAAAARSQEQAVAPVVAPKVEQFPETSASKTETVDPINVPTTTIGNDRELANTVIARDNFARAV